MLNNTFEGLPEPVIKYINSLEEQINRLNELLRLAQKARFGSSSEKARYILEDGLEQVYIFNEAEVFADEDAPEPVIVQQHQRKPKRTKEELAKDLPVKEVIIDIPEDERICNICKGELHLIGKELVRRELGIIPAQAYVIETYQMNYACDDCEKETEQANIIKPEVPVPVVKRGLASPSSIAYTMYQKYANAMPLARQESDWKTFGVILSRATLANWIIYASLNWLLPLWYALKAILLTSPVILADESVIQVLDEPGKTPQSESRMWVYCTGNVPRPPPVVLFEYQPSRAGEHPKAFLKGAQNFYLLTDAYAGYNAVEGAIHCACFAHTRRRFEEAMPKNAPADNSARIGFEFCQELFMLERKFEKLSPEERLIQRHKQSKPVLDKFYKWIETVHPLAGSKLAQAIGYAVNQKKTLSSFLLDGCIEISTNRIENCIRPFSVGRKNYLFAATVNGARASAIAYSIIESARKNGLNPFQYLLHLFTELPTVLTKNPNADLSPFFPWSDVVQKKCKYAQDLKGQLRLFQ